MPPEQGGDITGSLTTSRDAPTADSGQDTVPVGSDDHELNGQTIEYAEGEAHGVTVHVQLNDDNELYDKLVDAQRELNNERGQNATSNNPHYLGDIDASWTDGIDELGFFSTGVQYGHETRSGSFTQYYAQVLNLYDSVDDSRIANNPAKRRLEVHKRADNLVYSDGNEYTWPGGWITGKQHEGTYLKIQCSYVDNPGNAIADAFELLEGSGLLKSHELQSVKRPITETVRFSGLESHHRVDQLHEHDAIETLRDSARLISSEGDGRIHGDIEKGHHQIYGVETTNIHALGFGSTVEWTYRGDAYSSEIDKHYLKCYRHKNAELFGQTDPRAHPKIETKAHGGYPGPAWNAVKEHLDAILNAHTADWAGIPETGLVEDKYHDGPEQATTTTVSPTEYRINLKDYFKSNGLKKQIIEVLVNNRTKSAHDILYTVMRLGRKVTYDELKEETGLTKRTIRKWCKRLEELPGGGVLEREFSGQMFVRMPDLARAHLRKFIEATKPNGDIKRAIRKRKHERINSRQTDSSATDGPTVAMTDGGTDRRPKLPTDSETPSMAGDGDHATHEPITSDPPPD